MTGPGFLGSVEVDVELNVRDVGPRLRRALRRPAERVGEEVERQWARSGGDAGRSYADAFRKAVGRGDFASGLSRSARRSFDGFTTEAERAADRAKRALAEATRSEQLLRIDADIRQAQAKIRELESKRGDTTINVDADIARAQARIRSLAARRDVLSINVDTDGLDAARKQMAALAARSAEVAEQSQRARHAIGSLVVTGAKITAVGAAAGGAAAVMGSLAVNTLAVGAALGQAAGSVTLLPAALGSMTASVGALVVGFQGMGEALGAVMDEDPDKLADAMKELTPAARSAVRAFQSLRPQLEEIREATQESLFAGLDDEIRRLDSTLLPTLERGLSRVAEGLNRQLDALFDALSDRGNLAQFDAVFENTAIAAEALAPAVKDVTRALGTLSGVGSGFMPRLAEATADAASKFANFIEHAERTGELAGFMERSIDAMSQLGRIVRNVGSGIGSVFSAASEASGGLLGNLEALTAKFAEWAGSDTGQDTMLSLFESLKTVADAVMPVIKNLVELIANDLAPLLGEVAETVGPGAVEFVKGLGEAIGNATPGIVEFAESFGDLLTRAAPLLDDIGAAVGFLAESLGTLVGWVSPVVGAFADLNDSMGGVPLKIAAVVAGVYALNRAFSALSLSSGLRDLSKQTRRELDGVGREVDRAGRDVENKGRTFGQRLGSGLTKGVKALPIVGAVAAVLNEMIELTDAKTGEVVGLIDAIGLGLSRAWDAVASAFGPKKVAGQAESVVDRYGEAFARLPDEVRAGLMELDATFSDAYLFHEEAGRELVRQLAEGYLAGTEQVRFAVGEFWSGMALDAQTGTTNMNTAVTGAMTTMQAVMTGGLSMLQTANTSAWQDIVTMTTSKSLSASEAVRGSIAVARTVMSGGLAAMVSDTSSAWSRMQSSTRSGSSGVRSAAAGVASGLAAQFGGLPGKFFAVGRDMMAGLRSGIVSMAFTVAASVGNVVGGAIAMARRMAATNSPSRVFMQIGRDMGAGLAIGMQQTQRMVANAGGGLAVAAAGGAAGVIDGMPGVHGGTGGVSSRTFSSNRQVTNNFTISTAAQDPRAVAAMVKARIDSAAAGVI